MTISQSTALTDSDEPVSIEPSDIGISASGETSAHEQLLIRHGLISHIVQVDESADETKLDDILRQTSRMATNTMRIGPRRFGILLDATEPEGFADVNGMLSVIAVRKSTNQDKADEYPAAGASEGVESSSSASASDSDPAGEVHRVEGDRLARIEGQLEALAARLDIMSPAVVADQIIPVVDELVTRRIEAEDRARSETAEIRDSWKKDSAQFWDGMEAVLRLLSASANDIVGAGKAILDVVPKVEGGADLSGQVGVADKLQTLTSVLEENRISAENSLAAIDASLAVSSGDQAEVLATLNAEIKEFSATLTAAISQSDERNSTRTDELARKLAQIEAGLLARPTSHVESNDHSSDFAAIGAALGEVQGTLGALANSLSELEATSSGGVPVSSDAASFSSKERFDELEHTVRNSVRLLSALTRDVGTLISRKDTNPPPAADTGPGLEEVTVSLTERLSAAEATLLAKFEASSSTIGTLCRENEAALASIVATLSKFGTPLGEAALEGLEEGIGDIASRQIEADAFVRQLGRALAEGLAHQYRLASKSP